MDCSTKSRIREIPLPGVRRAPKPLGSSQFPRGIPGLKGSGAARVQSDNMCSDFLLATQQILHEHGRGAMRENPGNSLHWVDPCELSLEKSGEWSDFDYYSCVFLSARKKFQRIRHNLAPMRELPFQRCGHIHQRGEGAPTTQAGRTHYPSHDEAEYSASLCFTIVVCASHWAVDQGFAVSRIQRMPPIQASGDWRGLLELPSQVFRADAMDSIAAHTCCLWRCSFLGRGG